MVGGALARPCEAYPTLFARGTIWDRYPYLLPNLFSVVVVCGAVAIGILFFEETHAVHRHRRDVGIELGRWLAERSCLRVFNPWAAADRRQARREEKQPLLLALDIDVEGAGGGDDDQLPGYAGPLPSPHSKGAALSHLRGIGFTPEPPTPTITSAVATPESMVIVGTGPDQPRPSPAPCGSNLASGVAVAAKTKEQLQQQQKQLEPAGGSFPKTVKWVIVTYGILAL